MVSSNTYSIQLPYLGTVSLGEAPITLSSFQAPVRDLYVAYEQKKRERCPADCRIVISDCDLLIFEPDAASRGKRTVIYANLDCMVDIQTLKLSLIDDHAQTQAAFLPIGCEHQDRFRSLYTSIDPVHRELLSTPASPPLVSFVVRKTDVHHSTPVFDCHVFAVHRESTAFDLCDMLRKLIMKRPLSPILSSRRVLQRAHEHCNDVQTDKQPKYLNRNRPVSVMEYPTAHRPVLAHRKNKRSVSTANLKDVVHSTVHTSLNPFSSSLLINHAQHSLLSHDKPQELANTPLVRRMSPPSSTTVRTLSLKQQQQQQQQQSQRRFIKASSLVKDECEEIVNDLMNIVAAEKLKSQASTKRHASFDQMGCTMNKKRYFQHKKRLLTSLPTTNNISPNHGPPKLNGLVHSQFSRPQTTLNNYGDIGNYVPKFLREQAVTRSSDSNENIFFRSTNGQVLNGFLQLDFPSSPQPDHRASMGFHHNPPLFPLIQQLRRTQTKSPIYSESPSPSAMEMPRRCDDNRILRIGKSRADRLDGARMLSYTPSSPCRPRPMKSPPVSASKPKRAASLTIADTELPINYRQYLRPTNRSAHLYGPEQQASLGKSLGYLP